MRTSPVLLLALVALLADASEQANIPEPFRGRWGSVLEKCRIPDEGRLVIEAAEVSFYESRGKVLAVRRLGPRDIEIDLDMSGEGSVWKDTRRFVLSEDGQRLTNIMGTREHSRVRCE